MLTADQAMRRNRILSALTKAEYRLLRPHLEQVCLHEKEVLYTPGDVVRHIYFPDDSVVSLLCGVNERPPVEVAMEGNEGVVGFTLYLGGLCAHNLCVVRVSGTAMRMSVNALRKCESQRGRFHDLLHRYVYALVTQVAQSGVCGRYHNVDSRLARWLLMTQDRVGSAELHATQDSIACMLGVRRSSVTAAASSFLKQSMIEYRRGRIEILDRRRLGAAACSCYGIIKAQYDSYLKP